MTTSWQQWQGSTRVGAWLEDVTDNKTFSIGLQVHHASPVQRVAFVCKEYFS